MRNWMLDLFLKGSQAADWHGKLRKREEGREKAMEDGTGGAGCFGFDWSPPIVCLRLLSQYKG